MRSTENLLTADSGQMAADKDLSFRDCGTITYRAQRASLRYFPYKFQHSYSTDWNFNTAR